MHKKLYVTVFILLSFSFCLLNKAESAALTPSQLARISVESYLDNKKLDSKNINLQGILNKKPVGVFVTILDKNNHSKGCWGKLYPQSNLQKSIINAALDASTKDYRTRPLRKSDLKDVKFQVSIVSQIIPVSSTRAINPFKDGLLVQSGGKTGIILPGEAVDSYYQMVMAKLKAGISPKQKCNLFKLVTKTYKE